MPRSTKQGNNVAVQGTNDSSIVSKCSTASQGYFNDDFLRLFVSKTSRRAPLINRGYYIRARVIDDILKQFLSVCPGKKQIISLGAGFDSAFFRLHASGHLVDTTFYEVDFPGVVRRKATIIKTTAQLRQQLNEDIDDAQDYAEGIYLTSPDYHLLGVDLTNLHGLQRCLQQTGVSSNLPTLLLSECVLTYMEVCSSDALIQWASAFFPNGVFLTYEQIHPSDAFGLVMRKHFDKLNSSLKAIQTYPSVEAQQQRFLSLGWQETSAIDMNTYYSTRLPVRERLRVESLEPFDEFEEWHLKCGHYAVIAGCNGACSNMAEFFAEGQRPSIPECITGPTSILTLRTPETNQRPLRRFGHASSLLSTGTAIVMGGFGEVRGKHTRLGDVVIIDLTTGTWGTVPANHHTQDVGPRMHHSLTAISGGNRWFLFGGRSSPTKPCNSTVILTFDTKHDATGVPETSDQMSTASQDGNQVLLPDSPNCSASKKNSSAQPNECETYENGLGLVGRRNTSANKCQHFGDHSERTACVENDKSTSISKKMRTSDKNFPPMATQECEISGYSYQCIAIPHSDGPAPRWRHSAVCADVRGKECVVIYGGRGTADTVLSDCWAFDVSQLDWDKLKVTGDRPPACHSHSACVWQGTRMVIAGGLGTDMRPLTSVHVLDLETLKCQELKLTPSLPPRYSHTAHVVGSRLLLVGGVNPLGGHGYTIAVVDLEDLTWHLHFFPVCVVERPLMVHSHTSELLTDTSLAVFGGGGNCFSFGTHLNDSTVVVRVPL